MTTVTPSALAALAGGRVAPDLLEGIAREVALVEEELLQQTTSQSPLVERVARHVLRGGGKRLRPAFVSLAARAAGSPYEPDRTRRLGACMEMIHMATLVHDDVIDNSATRRGLPTAGTVFGNTASILSGDVLLAKAMSILAHDGDLEIIRTVSAAVVAMAEGEVRELEVRGDFDLSEEAHLEVLHLKTAAFIEGCCETGALVAGASPEVREALRAYGYHIGMAFQVVDDLLDYRGERVKTGKPLATDFREGCATLPLIYLRGSLTDAESRVARGLFGANASEDELRMVADWMTTRGAFVRAEGMAKEHIAQALEALRALPDNDACELLRAVAEYVLARQA